MKTKMRMSDFTLLPSLFQEDIFFYNSLYFVINFYMCDINYLNHFNNFKSKSSREKQNETILFSNRDKQYFEVVAG